MKVINDMLHNLDGSPLTFVKTKNQGRKLKNAKPKFIVIHYTAGSSAQSAINWFKDPAADASAHLVIDHNGSITQMVKFNEKAWHAGESSWDGLNGLNQYSVGIEIANWGELLGSPGNWSSYTGKVVPDNRVIQAAHRYTPHHIKGWEIYDEAQVESAVLAVRSIANEYGIEENNILGHDHISPDRKSDPGPAWDMNRFRTRVFGRKSDTGLDLHFEVIAESGLNMRMLPNIGGEKIKTLALGTKVAKIETDGLWWLVAEIIGGKENDTGWVHSRWLKQR